MIPKQLNHHDMLTWFLSPKSCCLDQEGPWRVSMVAQALQNAYGQHEKQKIIGTFQIEPSILDEKDYTDPYLFPVLEMKKIAENLRPYISHFFIHGSLATLDFVKGWSDFDTLVVVSNKAFENPKNLIELRNDLLSAYPILQKIDPLQHHGFIVCSEDDLQHYPTIFLPAQVLKLAKSLLQENKISFSLIDTTPLIRSSILRMLEVYDDAAKNGIFRHHPFQGEFLKKGFKDKHNGMYQLKYYLGWLMTLPARYLEAKRIPGNKKGSFKFVRSEFGESMEVIDRASKVRAFWGEKETHPYKGNAIPEWVIEILSTNYMDDVTRLTSTVKELILNLD